MSRISSWKIELSWNRWISVLCASLSILIVIATIKFILYVEQAYLIGEEEREELGLDGAVIGLIVLGQAILDSAASLGLLFSALMQLLLALWDKATDLLKVPKLVLSAIGFQIGNLIICPFRWGGCMPESTALNWVLIVLGILYAIFSCKTCIDLRKYRTGKSTGRQISGEVQKDANLVDVLDEQEPEGQLVRFGLGLLWGD